MSEEVPITATTRICSFMANIDIMCAVLGDSIFVLTIKYGAMDLPNRLAELEPQLPVEAEMLYEAWQRRRL